MESIVEEQYNLSRGAGISILESENMADFDRVAYGVLLARDLQKEAQIYSNTSK
ncbi:MAG: hypothetical protein ACOCRK_00235 [bacterium]